VASALADGLVTEEPATMAHYLQELNTQVDRLAALIDDLFTLARLEGPAPELARAPYPTDDLLSTLLERAQPLAREAGVTLEVTVAPSMPAVLVDVRQIERVLDNLVRNALQHTPPGGAITVRAAPYGEEGREVLITVADTGEGIAPADVPLLFELYYRGSRRGHGAGGAGLGLAIVKAVAQAHGGRVWAKSPPPGLARGALIGVVLPAAQAQPA
jgi:two-component system sensor histidine kinase BaeS